MVIVAGAARVRPDRWASAVAAAKKLSVPSRSEPGCLEYGFYTLIDRPYELGVLQRWESEKALHRHLAASHTVEFLGVIGPMLEHPPTLQVYTVESSRPLMG